MAKQKFEKLRTACIQKMKFMDTTIKGVEETPEYKEMNAYNQAIRDVLELMKEFENNDSETSDLPKEDDKEQKAAQELPCKVGDTIYTACAWGVERHIVKRISIEKDKIFIYGKNGVLIGEGDKIFLNEEQAWEVVSKMNGYR